MNAKAVVVSGILALSALGTVANAQNSGSDSSSSQSGFGAKLGHFFNSLTNGPQDQGASAPAASAAVDTSKWNILGIKLGDSPDDAEAAVKAAYPQAIRVDNEQHFTYRQFTTPLLVLATRYVAGKASAIVRPGVVAHGAGELGDESETLDVEYVWPSMSRVLAIRRDHVYASSARGTPGSLPSADAILKGLTERFGPPDATYRLGGYGPLSPPTITWTWDDDPPALRGRRVELCPASVLQFAGNSLHFESNRPDPTCGTFLVVTVNTVGIATGGGTDQYAAELTETLADSRALTAAAEAFQTYMLTGQDSQAAALKAKAAALPPPKL